MQLIRRDPDLGFLDTLLWVPKKHMNVEGTKRALTFVLEDASVLSLWKETEHHILVPREFWRPSDLPFEIVDCRPVDYPTIEVTSRIKLDHRPDDRGVLLPTGETVQQEALHALMQARGGILQLGCGKGKTIIFLELIARMCVPTLIVIDNTQLLEQWLGEIHKHLDLPGGIGLIKADVFDWQKSVVLTTFHTLAARADFIPVHIRNWFGLVGWDEGHHSGAQTFSRTLDIFPSKRIVMTATPDRDDGLHIVYNFHVGKVVYKDLKPEMIPRIVFLWTGFSVDLTDPTIAAQVKDRTGDLHLKKLAGYFGRVAERRKLILDNIKAIRDGGRHVLVISESIEALANLFAAWTGRPSYTDIALPTTAEVSAIDHHERASASKSLQELEQKMRMRDPDTDPRYAKLEQRKARLEERLAQLVLDPSVPPVSLTGKEQKKLKELVRAIQVQLLDHTLNPVKRQALMDKAVEALMRLRQHAMAEAVEAELDRRQRAFLRSLADDPRGAGLLVEEVDAPTRLRFVREHKVVFSIAKYGREGLDNPEIDTVFVCEAFSGRNILQQLLGRPSRKRPNKKTPVFVVLEDEIGPVIGMCTKLRQHLRQWPEDEGGPFKYELVGHPTKKGVRHG